MVSSTRGRPFYGTIWFSLAATVFAAGLIFVAAASMPNLEGRPTKGFGQFGVVLVAAYWALSSQGCARSAAVKTNLGRTQASVPAKSSSSGKLSRIVRLYARTHFQCHDAEFPVTHSIVCW